MCKVLATLTKLDVVIYFFTLQKNKKNPKIYKRVHIKKSKKLLKFGGEGPK